MPVIILAVAGGLLYISRQRGAADDEHVRAAVRALVEETAANLVTDPEPGPIARRMNASQGTIRQLARTLEAQPAGRAGLDIQVESGDVAPPYGDGSATHRAYISVQGVPRLGLRIFFSRATRRTEVLGYWTP